MPQCPKEEGGYLHGQAGAPLPSVDSPASLILRMSTWQETTAVQRRAIGGWEARRAAADLGWDDG